MGNLVSLIEELQSTATTTATMQGVSTLPATTPTSIPSTTISQSYIPSSIPISVSSSTTPSTTSFITSSIPSSISSSITPSITSSVNMTTAIPSSAALPTSTAVTGDSVLANILVLAGSASGANVATSGLNGYGIPFTQVIVPQAGIELPVLEDSSGGKFGGIVVAGQVSYDYGQNTWHSALTQDQWNQLYAYQIKYGVRMVQYDVYPGTGFGTSAGTGCCGNNVEQLISFSDTSEFAIAGLKTGAGMSTKGLWHYPATITNSTTTKEIAKFEANADAGLSESTAAVINNFDGRQQMAFFIGWATNWSPTSNFLQHAWIIWLTRGLYPGYRRVNLNTQIDDMFLESDIYKPAGKTFRIRTGDLEAHVGWTSEINAKMNPGSDYFIELGHNGNGNIEAGADTEDGDSVCAPGPIEYDEVPDPPLEFKKPLGTGTNRWPKSPTTFVWTEACMELDPLEVWFSNPANRDNFAHLSHTFTHLELNNATYNDAAKEISVNQAWLQKSGISSAARFTAHGIIPPAITGLHNGDVLRAWQDNGIFNVVGDNSRPVLVNQENPHHPYITTVEADGFAGIQVNPRWSTRIYYNCDSADCTTQEWIDTSAGSGGFADLLAAEKADTTRYLLGLSRSPFMFHQANLRQTDVQSTEINGVTAKRSLLQAWVETIVQEFVRLVDWPMITLKHQDMSDAYAARAARDSCNYSLTWNYGDGKITGVTVGANGNTCSSSIPVTFPSAPTDTQGFQTEQVGNDPLTVWVTLSGSPVSFTLSEPIAL